MPTSIRPLNYLFAFIIIAFILGSAAFLQIYKGITPCPLCILQRITMGLLGVLFLLGIAFSAKPLGRWIIGILCALTSLLGILLSGRQVYLQLNPSNVGANCEVSLEYMLNALPFNEVLKRIIAGGAECSRVDWQILHISLAQWSSIAFIIFLLFSLWQLRRG